ncbi:glycosyltransferase [Sphingomonas sp. CGMCC 1.13654]|uniref:Glycosyltransferase n=1 Tax=Sphingomonas chungangi TaxID=2683589 RepID=A0A838L6W9_9SPHN|nr:glycosyltransferase [Sphingomonas chungangi]MBA2934239.1 glycosyltransferase [Sphingomonas chungangi]
MIRVAHLLPNMVTGGRERIVADLCRHAGMIGVEPSLILYDPDAEGRRIDPGDVPQHALDRHRPDFAAALRDLLARERIDVLHAQGHIAAALAAPVAHAVPMVTSLHVALGSGWRWAPAIARGLRASRAVTAVSADLARRFRWLAGLDIEVVSPGIDLPAFRPAERPANHLFTIGIAARLHPVKRHRDAIEAIRLLKAQGVAARLSIAGQGPLETDLRVRAAGFDVEFVGDMADMPGWFAGLDAFLLCSDHEGVPLALIEACASGLPCIAAAVGGIQEAFGDAILAVPRRRPDAVAAAVRRLATDRELRVVLARKAMERAGRFSLDAINGVWHSIYEAATPGAFLKS